jgi:carotenoid cleavage dioxygenase-like enzyme
MYVVSSGRSLESVKYSMQLSATHCHSSLRTTYGTHKKGPRRAKTFAGVSESYERTEVAASPECTSPDDPVLTESVVSKLHLLNEADYGEHAAAFLSGNYEPVSDEITAIYRPPGLRKGGGASSIRIVGSIPADFPLGQYAYIGPNPKFPLKHYQLWGRGPNQDDPGLGISWHHWFEGDGMIYAIDFCANGVIKFRNRFVRTSSWRRESSRGSRLFRPLMNAEGSTFLINALFNLLAGGSFMKDSANTALVHFAGRTFALQDTCPPWEVEPETLSTIGSCSFGGRLPSYVPFTAHPKVLPHSGELIFFGFNPVSPPHCTVGSLSAEGEVSSMNSLWSLPFVGSIFMHDFCVTQNFTILFEGSIDIKPFRQFIGCHPLQYNEKKTARFGVINRATGSKQVTWFNCSCAQMVYHFINSWEEKNEAGEPMVVITGIREDGFFQEAMRANGARNWIRETLQKGEKIPRAHEWRINLVTGNVSERYLFDTALETPRINDSFVGQKNRYAYAGRILLTELEETTQLKFDAIVKIDMKEETLKVYEHGPNRYGMEAQFVPRPGSQEEDDGWLVMYVHDETGMSTNFKGRTECAIFDAKSIESGPLASIILPERVPYGAHCMWRPVLSANSAEVCDFGSPEKSKLVNSPKMFAFKAEQRDDLLQEVMRGMRRLALGLFTHGWFPSVALDSSDEYAFVRGGGLRFYESNRLGNERLREAEEELIAREPKQPSLVLYDIEDDESCRAVREVLSILDVSYVCKPCPLGSRKYREELAEIQQVAVGNETVPFLLDAEGSLSFHTVHDIIQYLYLKYLDRSAPELVTSLLEVNSNGPSSCHAVLTHAPKAPLILWGYEASPFCALVRRALCELELPYICLPCARGSPRRTLFVRHRGAFQVPYLEDPNSGVSLYESSEIVHYLNVTYIE